MDEKDSVRDRLTYACQIMRLADCPEDQYMLVKLKDLEEILGISQNEKEVQNDS